MSDVIKKVCLKGWFTRHQICRQNLLLKETCRTQKIRPDFLFWPPFLGREMQPVNCLPPRTIVFRKIIFRDCPINHSLSNEVVGQTMI